MGVNTLGPRGAAPPTLVHLRRAITNPDHKTSRRVNDLFWAVVNGLLCALAASFVLSPSKPS